MNDGEIMCIGNASMIPFEWGRNYVYIGMICIYDNLIDWEILYVGIICIYDTFWTRENLCVKVFVSMIPFEWEINCVYVAR